MRKQNGLATNISLVKQQKQLRGVLGRKKNNLKKKQKTKNPRCSIAALPHTRHLPIPGLSLFLSLFKTVAAGITVSKLSFVLL